MLRRVASPYNVNGIALACLGAALDDHDYIASYIAQVLEGRRRLERFYSERNIPYWPSQANFVLAYFGEYREALVKQMRERGILVRDRNSDPGCAGCVRITLGNDSQTELLLRELPEALASIGFNGATATHTRRQGGAMTKAAKSVQQTLREARSLNASRRKPRSRSRSTSTEAESTRWKPASASSTICWSCSPATEDLIWRWLAAEISTSINTTRWKT